MWKNTAHFFSKFGPHFTAVLSFFTVFFLGLSAFQQGGAVIDYYCSANSPALFGYYIKGYALCPVYSVAYFIFVTTIVVISGWFVVVVAFDAFGTIGSRILRRARLYSMLRRRAKVIVFPVVVNNKVYVGIANEEYLLNVRKICGRTDFSFDFRPYGGYVKWDKLPLDHVESNIGPRKRELLHFATIDTEQNHFTIHKSGGELIIPRTDTTLHFPLRITGSMFLGNYKFSKSYLDQSVEVVISYPGQQDIDVKIDRIRD